MAEENPVYGPFFGVMGAASAMIFSGKLDIGISGLKLHPFLKKRKVYLFRNWSSNNYKLL